MTTAGAGPPRPIVLVHGDADHVAAVLDRLALTDVVVVGHHSPMISAVDELVEIMAAIASDSRPVAADV